MTQVFQPDAEQKVLRHVSNAAQSVNLAFLAGYVDALGFIALFGVFTAHVTGNFILIGRELANPTEGILIRLLAFPAFVFSVALTRIFILALAKYKKNVLVYVYLLQFFLLCGFATSGYSAEPIVTSDGTYALLASVLGASAMAVQNTASKLLLTHLPPTTIMTGNVTQLVINFVDFARGAASETAVKALRGLFLTVISFGCGAVTAGFAYKEFGFLALSLPCLMLLWLAWMSMHDEQSSTS